MSQTATLHRRRASGRTGPGAKVVGNIGTALMLVLAIGGVVALGIGVVGFVQVRTVASQAEALYADGLLPVQDAGTVRTLLWRARWASLANLTAVDEASATKYAEATAAALDEMDTALATLATRTLDAEGAASREQFTTGWAQYLDLREQSAALKKAGKLAEWQAFRTANLNPAVAELIDEVDTLNAAAKGRAETLRTAATAARRQAETMIVLIGVGGIAVGATVGLLLARRVVGRLTGLRATLQRVSEGDLTVQADGADGTDIGRMTQAVDDVARRMREALRTISGTTGVLGSKAGDLRRASSSMSTVVQSCNARMTTVDESLDDVTESVGSVASGSEELGASIREIASNAERAAAVAKEAVSAADGAQELMTRLGAASEEIGNVVKLITSIAEQTNLLALNATIEAARAGDAGKGFAVVADEVKQLAQETARATEDISTRVGAIQSEAEQAIGAITSIGDVIGRISDYQETIAAAVEEQSAVTQGMSGDLHRAAEGARKVKEAMDQVVRDAEMQGETAASTDLASRELTEASAQLTSAVGAFRV